MGRANGRNRGGGSGPGRTTASAGTVSSLEISSRRIPFVTGTSSERFTYDPDDLLEGRGLDDHQSFLVIAELESTVPKYYKWGEKPNRQEMFEDQAQDLVERVRWAAASDISDLVLRQRGEAMDRDPSSEKEFRSLSEADFPFPEVFERALSQAQILDPSFTREDLLAIANHPSLSYSEYLRQIADDAIESEGIDRLVDAGMDEGNPEPFVRELIRNGGRYTVEAFDDPEPQLYHKIPKEDPEGRVSFVSYNDYLREKLDELTNPLQQTSSDREVLARSLGVDSDPEKLALWGKTVEADSLTGNRLMLEDGRIIPNASAFTWKQDDGLEVCIGLYEERNEDGRVLRAVVVIPGRDGVADWNHEIAIAEAYGDGSSDRPEKRVIHAEGENGSVRRNITDNDIALAGGSRQYAVDHLGMAADIALRGMRKDIEEARRKAAADAVNPDSQLERLLG